MSGSWAGVTFVSRHASFQLGRPQPCQGRAGDCDTRPASTQLNIRVRSAGPSGKRRADQGLDVGKPSRQLGQGRS
jgi:hypothetical protein